MRLLFTLPMLAIAFAAVAPAFGLTVTATSDISIWTAVGYGAVTPDPADDVTLTEADFVGNATDQTFYTAFDDQGDGLGANDELWFRTRVSGDRGAAGFSRVVLVGIDADGDGDIDLFVGPDNQGNPKEIRIWDPGTGLNTTPNNTTIVDSGISFAESGSNYDWSGVSVLDASMTGSTDPRADLDATGSGEDMFLTFMVPFDLIVQQLALQGITVTANTPLSYVVGSSNQPNALNEDLSGVGAFDPNMTFASLGVISTAAAAVPEPAAGVLALLGLSLVRPRPRR